MERTGERRRFGAWMAAVCAALALVATGASALSLADLAAGASLVAPNGVTYDHFRVKIRGGLDHDLTSYLVETTENGFAVSGGGRDTRGRGGPIGRIVLRYDVSTDAPGGLLGSLLSVDPGDGDAFVAARKKILAGKKRIARLRAKTGGTLLSEMPLMGPTHLSVKERIRLKDGFGAGSLSSGFAAVPEPSSLVLTSLGLLALATFGRRARA